MSAEADTPPVVNQCNFSPLKYRKALLEKCEEHDIALEPYSTLRGGVLETAVVTEIASRLGRDPGQVVLRWCVQRQLPVIPKSTKRERLESNADLFGFELSAEDMEALDGLDETGGTGRALERKWW